MTSDHAALIAAIDSGDRTALHLLADWYEERDSDLGAGLRWILRTGRRPFPFPSGKCGWFATDSNGDRSKLKHRLPVVFLHHWTTNTRVHDSPSAAYLDAAAAAVAALRSCCGQLWGEGEACGECGSKYRIADFYEPAEIEIDHDVRDAIRDWAND